MSNFIDGTESIYNNSRLLKNRLTVEGNVIGILYSDPCYFDEFNLKDTDFITKDGRFYYKVGKYLRNKGCEVIDEVAVISKLPDESKKTFEYKGGYDEIRKLTEVINVKNADVYIDDLNRENIILSLYKKGFNVLGKTEWKGKTETIIDVLRSFNSEEVIDWYESILAGFDTNNKGVVLEEEIIDFSDDFFNECAEGDNDGIPFETVGENIDGEDIGCYKFLSKQVSGLRRKTLSMIGGFSSAGKSTWLIAIIFSLMLQGEKIILISNEEEIKKYKIKMVVWILNKHFKYYKLTKKKLMSGNISDEDREMIKKFQEYWEENFKNKIWIVSINDSDFNTAKKKIRKAALDKGYSTFIIDTFKIEQSDMNSSRSDLALVKNCRDLHKVARKYNMIGIASVQLLESMKGMLFLDASVLVNCKQLKEDLENLFLMRPLYPEELDPKSKIYCAPYRTVNKDGTWTVEKFNADPSDVWRVLFVEKNRNGANSSDNGEAYLLKFMGDYAVFIEKAKCKPKHGRIG